LCEVVDAFAEDGHLHFRGSGVCVVRLVTANELCLAILGQRHLLYLQRTPQCRGTGCAVRPKIVSRARSTCYTRTTDGCKSPAAVAGRAIATSCPAGSSSRYRPDSGVVVRDSLRRASPESRVANPDTQSPGPSSRPWI